jgi:hypothetical protein
LHRHREQKLARQTQIRLELLGEIEGFVDDLAWRANGKRKRQLARSACSVCGCWRRLFLCNGLFAFRGLLRSGGFFTFLCCRGLFALGRAVALFLATDAGSQNEKQPSDPRKLSHDVAFLLKECPRVRSQSAY